MYCADGNPPSQASSTYSHASTGSMVVSTTTVPLDTGSSCARRIRSPPTGRGLSRPPASCRRARRTPGNPDPRRWWPGRLPSRCLRRRTSAATRQPAGSRHRPSGVRASTFARDACSTRRRRRAARGKLKRHTLERHSPDGLAVPRARRDCGRGCGCGPDHSPDGNLGAVRPRAAEWGLTELVKGCGDRIVIVGGDRPVTKPPLPLPPHTPTPPKSP